jgi:hypothetical protein
MMLDTGAWISFITSAHVHKLGVDILPQRTTMEFNHTAVKTVDVTMSVDGSHPFRTTVATAIGSFSSDVPLLSLLTS